MSNEVNLPGAFLTKTFLSGVLQTYENDSKLRVIDFTLTNAVDKGENYASNIYRIVAQYIRNNGENESKSIVVKVSLSPKDEEIMVIDFFLLLNFYLSDQQTITPH